jgi:hypothetical protein
MEAVVDFTAVAEDFMAEEASMAADSAAVVVSAARDLALV